MTHTVVKELLEKHFGLAQDSLTLGKRKRRNAQKSDRPQEVYFYFLENEKEITEICNLLGESFADKEVKLPELTQRFPKKRQKGACSAQCACFTERNDGGWDLAIHEITGVTYHRAHGGRSAATLRLSTTPISRLSDASSDFYGYWEASWFSRNHTPETERGGFSYWVNKALKTSSRFREFSADFFLAAAEEEQQDILKDVAGTIRRCGCFLPPISYEKLLTCSTPADVFRRCLAEDVPLDRHFDSVDLNTGYVMQMLAPIVEPQDLEKLAELDAKTVSDAVTLPLFYETFRAETFLPEYYKAVFECLNLPGVLAEDYVRLCRTTGAKFRIGYDRSIFKKHLRDLKDAVCALPC